MNRKIFTFGLLVVLVSGIAFSQQFTLAVLPDTQSYVNHDAQKSFWGYPINHIDMLTAQIEYLLDNARVAGGTIDFLVHEGDVVEHRTLYSSEWKNADKLLSKLDGIIPYLIAPGNHDCDRWVIKKGQPIQCHGWKTFCKYFGPNSVHFKDRSWYGGSFNGGTNSWAVQNISGYQVLFLALEVEPTDETLAWAQSVLDLNKGLPTIIVTHEYLEYGTNDPNNPAYLNFANSQNRRDEGGNSPETVWNKFISRNDQIFMVLCGHSSGEGIRIDRNVYGHNVYALLSDYQGRREVINSVASARNPLDSGDGWFRLMHFDIANSSVHVQTYSPYLDRYETDADSDFTINFDFDWKKRFPAANLQYLRTSFMKFVPTF